MNRLRSLSGLHAEANEVAERLRRLSNEEKKWVDEAEEMKGVVEGIQKGLGEAGEGVKKNWEALEGRMRGAEERLRALEG